jgi:hypothetical protein
MCNKGGAEDVAERDACFDGGCDKDDVDDVDGADDDGSRRRQVDLQTPSISATQASRRVMLISLLLLMLLLLLLLLLCKACFTNSKQPVSYEEIIAPLLDVAFNLKQQARRMTEVADAGDDGGGDGDTDVNDASSVFSSSLSPPSAPAAASTHQHSNEVCASENAAAVSATSRCSTMFSSWV